MMKMMKGIRTQQGFGLAEAVVSLVILGVVLAALLPAFANNIAIDTTTDLRTGAIAVAQEVLDELRAESQAWPATGSSQTVDTGWSCPDLVDG